MKISEGASKLVDKITPGAYFGKNFAGLSFEVKLILFAHLLTLLFCFFPWAWMMPSFGAPVVYSAFSREIGLIGTFVFFISLATVVIFADQLFEINKVKLSVSKNLVFGAAGTLSVILLVCAWSVLISVGSGYEQAEIRFGFLLTFLMQAMGIAGVYLNGAQTQKSEAEAFFQHPEPQKTSDADNKKTYSK